MWMKVDDRMHTHRKTRNVIRSDAEKSRDAAPFGLWVLAGSWSAQNDTDGWVPIDELERFDEAWEALAKRLVAADYWWPETRDGEDGYGFVDWHEWNGRERESADGKFGNHKRWHLNRGLVKEDCEFCPTEPDEDHSIAPDSGGDIGGDSGAESTPESGFIANPYPIPSQSQSLSQGSAKRGSKLSKDWKPTTEHQARALQAGLVLGREVDKFKAHAEEKGRLAKNWNAAFTRWLMTAEEYAERNGIAPTTSTRPHASQLELPPDGLTPDEYAEWELEQRRKRGAR